MTTEIMVQLSGVGDGYGIVLSEDGKTPKVYPGYGYKKYRDGTPMPADKQRIHAAPAIELLDGGVRCSPGQVLRVIGPLDCDEAIRVRAERYTSNWNDSGFISLANPDELRACFAELGDGDEPTLYSRMNDLRAKYAAP